MLTFNDNRQPGLSHYVKDIRPFIHLSTRFFFPLNCHLSIIMVSGCWSPSQQSLAEKLECDEKTYEMAFHFYCLFSHCQSQSTEFMSTNNWSNTLWLLKLMFWPCSYFSWSAPFLCVFLMNGPVQAATRFEGTPDVLFLLFFCREKRTLNIRGLKSRGYLTWAFIKKEKRKTKEK